MSGDTGVYIYRIKKDSGGFCFHTWVKTNSFGSMKGEIWSK